MQSNCRPSISISGLNLSRECVSDVFDWWQFDMCYKLERNDCSAFSSEASEDCVKHISKFNFKICCIAHFPEHYKGMTSNASLPTRLTVTIRGERGCQRNARRSDVNREEGGMSQTPYLLVLCQILLETRGWLETIMMIRQPECGITCGIINSDWYIFEGYLDATQSLSKAGRNAN